MQDTMNGTPTASLKSARVREWLIVASFVLISAYGFWAIWQPQENTDPTSGERASEEGEDSAADGAALTPPAPSTGS